MSHRWGPLLIEDKLVEEGISFAQTFTTSAKANTGIDLLRKRLFENANVIDGQKPQSSLSIENRGISSNFWLKAILYSAAIALLAAAVLFFPPVGVLSTGILAANIAISATSFAAGGVGLGLAASGLFSRKTKEVATNAEVREALNPRG